NPDRPGRGARILRSGRLGEPFRKTGSRGTDDQEPDKTALMDGCMNLASRISFLVSRKRGTTGKMRVPGVTSETRYEIFFLSSRRRHTRYEQRDTRND